MTQRIEVRIAGKNTNLHVNVTESTTAAEILKQVGCEGDWVLYGKVGLPPFTRETHIHEHLDGIQKLTASPEACIC